MMNGFGGMGTFDGLWMWVVLLVGLALTASAIWGFSSLFPLQANEPQRNSASIDILSQRYAAGEISQAEYQQAREILVEA